MSENLSPVLPSSEDPDLPRGAVREVPLRPYRRHRWLDPLSSDFVEAYRRAQAKARGAAAAAAANPIPQGDLSDALD